jgi:3-oxoacyl-[acyl-carrier-protein] synthase-1
MIVGRVPHLEGNPGGVDRFLCMVREAAREAMTPLEAQRRNAGTISLILGLPSPRPGRPDGLEKDLADHLQTELRVNSIEFISTGHSAGLMALQTGWQRVLQGAADICLVGGVDSYLESETLRWLQESDQVHGGDNAYGFIPGEGAGFCLLCSVDAAERLRLQILGRVGAVATSRETRLIKTDSICLGKGLTQAFKSAIEALPSQNPRIERTICDLNGEPYRADEYGFAVSRLSNHFVDATDIIAPADCWGDVGAASGPLFVNLVAASFQRGYPKTNNLLWTSSETGERSAALLYAESPEST